MTSDEKKILLAIVVELEDARANQALLIARVGQGVNLAVARAAKSLAMQESVEHFATLRKQSTN
jgi:hypothetical protein